MMIPTPRFAIGDKVWDIDVNTVNGKHPCPDCGDTRIWTATSAVGETFTINCLRCSQSYANLPRDVPPLTYQKATHSVRELTIGSVKIDTSPHYADPVQYMCVETGVGSGRVYNESKLYATEAEARRAAEEQERAQQAKLDAGPVNPIRAEAATLTLSAAIPHQWQEEIYHAWAQARDLGEVLNELLKDEDHEYELNDATIDKINDALSLRPWRRPHPVATLIEAVRADLSERSEITRQAVEAALVLCKPPEHRTAETTELA